MDILEEQIEVAGRQPLPVFIARPADDRPGPAVIIFFEIFGLNENIRGIACRLAEAGFVGIAPDFSRHAPVPYEQFQEARAVASTLSDEGAMSDAAAVMDYVGRQPYVKPGKTGVVGFCMGGRLAFLTACRYPEAVGACVDYYGARMSGGRTHDGQTLVPLDEAPALECPLLLFFGGKDAFIPEEERQKIEDRLVSVGKAHETYVYPEADHGFCSEGRASYNTEAAADSWRRTVEFLGHALANSKAQ